jgi:hypothetical protein
MWGSLSLTSFHLTLTRMMLVGHSHSPVNADDNIDEVGQPVCRKDIFSNVHDKILKRWYNNSYFCIVPVFGRRLGKRAPACTSTCGFNWFSSPHIHTTEFHGSVLHKQVKCQQQDLIMVTMSQTMRSKTLASKALGQEPITEVLVASTPLMEVATMTYADVNSLPFKALRRTWACWQMGKLQP